MADQGLTKFEIMQRKMAEKQKKREEARKGGGGDGGGAKKKKPKASGGDGDPSEKGLSKFELMQKRMAEKQKAREDAKKKGGSGGGGGGGGGGAGASSSGSGSDDDRGKSSSSHRKAMTTRINMNAVRDMESKNESESDEEERNEPYNRIGSRRETAQKNAKLRKYRSQIEILSAEERHIMDRPLEKGDAVIFYSRADKQYIPGVVDSIQKSGKETFYKLEKKYKSSFDPVAESKRLGKKVTMDDDPDRYRRTDKPALIKKDTYYSIMTNNDFDIELRLALLRIFRDKVKLSLAKHKKKADKVARINQIVGAYGKDGGGNIAQHYDENLITGNDKETEKEEKVASKPKISKSKTSMKVTSANATSDRVSLAASSKTAVAKKRDSKDVKHDTSEKEKSKLDVKKRKGGRTKSTNTLPTEAATGSKKSSRKSSKGRKETQEKDVKKSRDKDSGKKSKSPRASKKKSVDNDSSNDESSNKNSNSKKKKSSQSSQSESQSSSKGNKTISDSFAQMLPDTAVSEWSMGDISKWLMYLSNSPFVAPDEDDSDAEFYDEDELEMMAKKKAKLFDKYFQYFVAAQIDGSALLKLNKKSLAKVCKVKNSTDRTLLHLAIQDLKKGNVKGNSGGGGGGGGGASSSQDEKDEDDSYSSKKSKSKKKSKNEDSNDENDKNDKNDKNDNDDDWKPLKKFDSNPPAKMKKTKTVMTTVATNDDKRGPKKKEIALRVGGGGDSGKGNLSVKSGRGPRPVSARRDHEHKPTKKRFHDSDDDEDIESESDSEEDDDDDDEDEQDDKHKSTNKRKQNVKDSASLTRKLGGWDSDSDE